MGRVFVLSYAPSIDLKLPSLSFVVVICYCREGHFRNSFLYSVQICFFKFPESRA